MFETYSALIAISSDDIPFADTLSCVYITSQIADSSQLIASTGYDSIDNSIIIIISNMVSGLTFTSIWI